MIKVLGICGSPRRFANSEFLLEQALDGAKEAAPSEVDVELYLIKGKKYAPCVSCFKCVQLGGECTRKDDFQELRDKWLKADAIIYSIPVYHMSIPGQLKCFIDRLGNSQFSGNGFTMPHHLKVIAAIAQGGTLFSGQEHAITDLINHAFTMGCIPAGGDREFNHFGAAGWSYGQIERDALKSGYERGESTALVAVKGARSTGRRAVELALVLTAGIKERMEIIGRQAAYKPTVTRLSDRISFAEEAALASDDTASG
ncbi:MAG: flavodoxin family protein [Chloroflexi bacterium]|nr:flavodoxin family protein [Chloroflexota bacterium]